MKSVVEIVEELDEEEVVLVDVEVAVETSDEMVDMGHASPVLTGAERREGNPEAAVT